jgi:hypothetical protein
MMYIWCIHTSKYMIEDKILIIKRLFEEGLTPTMVANKVGINRKNIHYYINKYKIVVKNKHSTYLHRNDYFNNIDTENKAYLLGFIIADGYLSEGSRICLNNSIDDIEVLDLFNKEVSPESKIMLLYKQKGAKFRKQQAIIRVTSKEMYKTLVNKYGIVQNKTQNSDFKFNFSLIPENLHCHFIRGYFDGDGSVSFYKTNRTIFFNFSFVFNSLNFTKQFAEIFETKFNIRSVIYNHIGKTANWHSLRFDYNRNRTNKIKEIYEYLYKDATIFLSRKKVKFDNYLEYRAKAIDNTIEQCNA